MSAHVAVVGGGLAGITAALRCADAGLEVTLVESRPRLGGLTHSFQRGDLWVDNGQHVFLRCCTAYLALLDRLGMRDQVHLQPRLDVVVRSEEHPEVGRLTRTGLPAPLHLLASLARYRWLPPTARVGTARAALALGRLDREDPAVDRQAFGPWLREHGQSDRAIHALWDLIGVATLNAPADEASLALAATVFQVGLLGETDAADIGWAAVPLQRLHGDAAAAALAEAGVEVRLGTKIRALEQDGSRWRLPDLDRSFDHVVLAAPASVTEALLPAGALEQGSGWSDRLGSVPILNVHLVFDRPVLDEPFVAAVDSPLQWVFDRSAAAGLDSGQYVAVSLSAADELAGRPVNDLREWVLPHLRRLLPRARTADLEEFFVTREPRATFRPTPGCRAFRPPTTTRATGLHLAGAWTDTGWPATMEGAVRSGDAAAAAILRTGHDGVRREEVLAR